MLFITILLNFKNENEINQIIEKKIIIIIINE